MKHQASPSFVPAAIADVDVARPAAQLSRLLARIPWLFVGMVVAPTFAAAIYFLFIAAPLYVSEAQFVVHTRDSNPAGNLGSKLQSVGVSLGSQSETDAYEVQQYMVSRDAVATLNRELDLRRMLARPEADFLERFPRLFEGTTFENLYRGYKRFVKVGLDSQTEISTLRVSAFRPADAQVLANALLNRGEALVNRLNDRAMADSVAQAQRQVSESEVRLDQVQAELTSFRNHQQLVDPDRTSAAGVEILGKLETDLASLRAERAGLAASTPESPQLPVIDRRIAAYQVQLDLERARQAGEADSLAPKVSEYERLTLERKLAGDAMEAAVAGLESARLDARRQQIFLERVVNPDLPDKAMAPKRLLTVLTVLISTLLLYAIVSLVIAGLREHHQR
jgi:capsular polysaccharide transport system permease protein